jgi:hypothetical protein
MLFKKTTLFALLLSHSFLMSQLNNVTNLLFGPKDEDGWYPESCSFPYENMAMLEWPEEPLFIYEWEKNVLKNYKKSFVGNTLQYDRRYPSSRVLDADIGWNRVKLRYQNDLLVLVEEIRWDISRKDAFAVYTALIMKNKSCGNWWKKGNNPNVDMYDSNRLNKIVESFYYKDVGTNLHPNGRAYRSISVFDNKGVYGVYQSFFFVH